MAEKSLMPLIQLAPKILVMASELQLVLGLYEIVSKIIQGDRIQIYNIIIQIIRTKLSSSQSDQIIHCMQTAVSVIEYADVLKNILSDIISQYNSTKERSLVTSDYDADLATILEIADRVNGSSSRSADNSIVIW